MLFIDALITLEIFLMIITTTQNPVGTVFRPLRLFGTPTPTPKKWDAKGTKSLLRDASAPAE